MSDSAGDNERASPRVLNSYAVHEQIYLREGMCPIVVPCRANDKMVIGSNTANYNFSAMLVFYHYCKHCKHVHWMPRPPCILQKL